jgi:hypothetical protein
MAFRTAIAQTNYDSVFEPAGGGRPAKLTIRLKVALNPLDPAAAWVAPPQNGQQPPTHIAANLAGIRRGVVVDYNGSPFLCRSWIVNEWNAFKIRFKQMVEVGWNNQILLLPTDDDQDHRLTDDEFRQLVFNPRYPAYVACAIDIQLVPIQGVAHALIEVAHLDQSSPQNGKFRVWMNRITDESNEFMTFHWQQWPDTTFRQITSAHEVGHWLHNLVSTQFDHIDAAYAATQPPAARAHAQYGHTETLRSAMMGDGSVATDHEAMPWLTRMVRHAHLSLGWTFINRANFDTAMPEISARQRALFP